MTEPTREDLLQELALKLDLANMELQAIDGVLARRPALSALKHRTDKIERACQAASEADKALCQILHILHMAKFKTPSNVEIERIADAAINRLRGYR